MSIFEYEEEKELRLLREAEREYGIEIGEATLGKLITRLFAEGRALDAELAAKDEENRKKFYKEIGMMN